MDYSGGRPLRGDAGAALHSTETVLLPNGFELVQATEHSREFRGGGMQSTRENPVRGASWIEVKARGGQLKLHARLDGVRNISLFFWIFPVVLWGGFAVAPLLGLMGEARVLNTEALKGMVVWLVLAPALTAWLRHRTVRALETLLGSAVVSGERVS